VAELPSVKVCFHITDETPSFLRETFSSSSLALFYLLRMPWRSLNALTHFGEIVRVFFPFSFLQIEISFSVAPTSVCLLRTMNTLQIPSTDVSHFPLCPFGLQSVSTFTFPLRVPCSSLKTVEEDPVAMTPFLMGVISQP